MRRSGARVRQSVPGCRSRVVYATPSSLLYQVTALAMHGETLRSTRSGMQVFPSTFVVEAGIGDKVDDTRSQLPNPKRPGAGARAQAREQESKKYRSFLCWSCPAACSASSTASGERPHSLQTAVHQYIHSMPSVDCIPTRTQTCTHTHMHA